MESIYLSTKIITIMTQNTIGGCCLLHHLNKQFKYAGSLSMFLLLDKGSFVDIKHLIRFCRAELSTLFR